MEGNCSTSSKGDAAKLNFLTLEDVIHLRKMDEEAAARSRFSDHLLKSQRRKLNNGAGADKYNGEIVKSTPSEKTGLENNLNIDIDQSSGLEIGDDDGSIPEGKWKRPSCSIGRSSTERDNTEIAKSDTMAAAAAEGRLSFSKKAPDASSTGKFSTGDERGRQRKHDQSKRQMYSPAGQARKEKYVRLRIRQQAKLLRSKRSFMEPSTQRTSHTELLQGFIIAGSLYRNLRQAWSDYELDCLWVGIHRHGLRKWEAMLRDPGLRFSRFKTAKDLADRWYLEDLNSTFPSFKAR